MSSFSGNREKIGDVIDWAELLQATADTNSKASSAKVIKGSNSNNSLIDTDGNDVLYGYGGNDDIIADFGNDKLYGGTGNDRLEGESGSDTFVFNTTLNSRTNVDSLPDFRTTDTIQLENKIFTKLTKTGTLSSSTFWTGSKAHDSNDRIIYNKSTGYLYYDQDGTGSKSAVLFAKLDKGLALTYKDFYVI